MQAGPVHTRIRTATNSCAVRRARAGVRSGLLVGLFPQAGRPSIADVRNRHFRCRASHLAVYQAGML
jgi:hypothetical protein